MIDFRQEKREYFRINDWVAIEFVAVEHSRISDDASAFPLPVPREFSLLNQLHAIDTENSSLLHLIGEKNRTLAAYLKSTNDKIDLLATALVHSDQRLTDMPQKTVTLSEGGLAFNNPEPLDSGTYLAIKMVLLPSGIGLLLYGQVVDCHRHSSENHFINIRFEQLSEPNRQIIARHVLQYQARARRQSIAQDMAGKES